MPSVPHAIGFQYCRYTQYLGYTDESRPVLNGQAAAAQHLPPCVAARLIASLSWLSAHPGACFLGILALEIVLRCALLVGTGLPRPSYHDEFSYLLAGDTYAAGRLANPPLPHPEFFETEHVLLTPAYASKYQPGHGFFLAFGQRVFGHPFFGVLLSVALGCATLYWALLGLDAARVGHCSRLLGNRNIRGRQLLGRQLLGRRRGVSGNRACTRSLGTHSSVRSTPLRRIPGRWQCVAVADPSF